MKYITIALAKGRLAKQTLALLEQTGITCEEMKDKETRKLIFVNEELGLKFFLSKTSDVPTYWCCRQRHNHGRRKKSFRGAGSGTWKMQYVCCRTCYSKRAVT